MCGVVVSCVFLTWHRHVLCPDVLNVCVHMCVCDRCGICMCSLCPDLLNVYVCVYVCACVCV